MAHLWKKVVGIDFFLCYSDIMGTILQNVHLTSVIGFRKEKVMSKKSISTDKKKGGLGVYFRRYWQLYALLALPLIYLFVFKYVPMLYVLVAFKKYNIMQNVLEMAWAKNHGLQYFIQAFNDKDFIRALRNTITLNSLDLIFGFPAPIIFALILNELPFKRYKKFVQTVAYMPHFLSWVIIYGLAVQLFTPSTGLLNILLNRLGVASIHFLDNPSLWIVTYVGLGVWQSFGWGSIIYLASIAGINSELYEAAAIDGAGRAKRMWHVTLPGIKPTIVVLLIMNLGNIIGSGFERPFAMKNNLVTNVANVISIYVYEKGIKGLQFSLTTAVGLFQSVVGLIFLLTANYISRRLGERGIW